MSNASSLPRNERNGIALIVSFALVKLLIHLFTNVFGGYGIFRDELYYIACSDHVDIGYVDQPPLSIFILALNRILLGDSIFALRFLPAVAGALTVYTVGRIAQKLGGGTYAQIFACLGSIVSIIHLAMNSIYSMNAFDHLFAALAILVTVNLLNAGERKYWIQLGCVLGLGALNKIGMIWIGGGIALGLLLSSHRRWFATPWPWLASLITILLFLPYIVWNLMHDFAHLEFIRNATEGKYFGLSPLTFILGQIPLQNPVTLPLWISGLYFFFLHSRGKTFRPLGIVFLFSFAVLAFNGHSKSEYLSSAYPILFAGGGVMLEYWSSPRSLRWIRPAVTAVLTVGFALAPLTLTILPVGTYIRYAEALGVKPMTSESKQLDKLPQFYADMFGWEEKAAAVARVYHRLTPEERGKCAIYADNYGRCGAIDYFGKKYDLPRSIGPHNNYWIWGPRKYTGELILILGGDLEDKQQIFESVVVADSVSSPYCMPYENNLKIYLCRKLKVPLAEFWPRIRIFI